MAELTFRGWLRAEISAILERKTSVPPLVLWCDPDLDWRELLVAAAERGAFELWAEDRRADSAGGTVEPRLLTAVVGFRAAGTL